MTQNNRSGHVQRKPASPKDWELAPSFKDVVCSSGQIPEEQSPNTQAHFTIHKCPELIVSTVSYLRGKHPNLRTGADIARAGTKCGALYFRGLRSFVELKQASDLVYELGNERARHHFRRQSYEVEVSLTTIPYTCYCFRWVASEISDTALTLGLPASTMAILTLVAAFTLNEEWLPVNKVEVFQQELERFENWLIHRFKDGS